MKITQQQLKQLIKEELHKLTNEVQDVVPPVNDVDTLSMTKDLYDGMLVNRKLLGELFKVIRSNNELLQAMSADWQ